MKAEWGKDPLVPKMLALAESGHPQADNLREKATEFEAAQKGYLMDDPPTVTVKGFMGAWARARRAWCEATGEPLI